RLHTPEYRLVARDCHAPLAGGDGLGGVERIGARVAQCAGGAFGQAEGKGMGRVLDDVYTPASRDLEYLAHAAGIAAYVHRHHDADGGIAGEEYVEPGGIEVVVLARDVAECHLGAELPGDGRAAREGIGADRHLRSRSDAQRIEGEEKSRGGRVDGEGPARAD